MALREKFGQYVIMENLRTRKNFLPTFPAHLGYRSLEQHGFSVVREMQLSEVDFERHSEKGYQYIPLFLSPPLQLRSVETTAILRTLLAEKSRMLTDDGVEVREAFKFENELKRAMEEEKVSGTLYLVRYAWEKTESKYGWANAGILIEPGAGALREAAIGDAQTDGRLPTAPQAGENGMRERTLATDAHEVPLEGRLKELIAMFAGELSIRHIGAMTIRRKSLRKFTSSHPLSASDYDTCRPSLRLEGREYIDYITGGGSPDKWLDPRARPR